MAILHPSPNIPRKPVKALHWLTAILATLASTFIIAATPAPAAAASAACRPGDPLANVWGEDRLKLVQRCITVTGTVDTVTQEEDGDVHVDLRLDPGQEHLLNAANRDKVQGDLVTEIVPADQPGCVAGQPMPITLGKFENGICTGADLATPKVGERVSEVGPYVLDINHGWMEVHPVWSITILASCRFTQGFATMHQLLPDVVGDCRGDVAYNPRTGDARQLTTRGLLVWRKADNTVLFTDGYRTWANGPHGIQMRLNTQLFPWEEEAPVD